MPFDKGNAASVTSRLGRVQSKSRSRQVLLMLKWVTGTDLNALAADNELALDATGATQREVCKDPCDVYSLTADMIRHNVYTWVRPGYRQYRSGTARYKRENDVARDTSKLVEEIQNAQKKGLYQLEPLPGNMGHGLFNLKHTEFANTLKTSSGAILRATFSNPLTVDGRKDTTLRGNVTQSEVDVNDTMSGNRKGCKKVHRLLNGLLQFVNHACSECATHESGDNWTCGPKSLPVLQRWWDLMPGVEITICYGDDDMHECYGPFCKPERWNKIVYGESHNGKRVRKGKKCNGGGGYTFVLKE